MGKPPRPKKAAIAEPGPRRPKGGKGATVMARITQELKDALVEESGRTGQSISHIAEAWMWEAHKGRAGVVEMLGGLETAETIRSLVRAANTIRDDFLIYRCTATLGHLAAEGRMAQDY